MRIEGVLEEQEVREAVMLFLKNKLGPGWIPAQVLFSSAAEMTVSVIFEPAPPVYCSGKD